MLLPIFVVADLIAICFVADVVTTLYYKPNITKEEHQAIKELRRDNTRMVLTADKGVSMVVMDKEDYKIKSEELLQTSTYQILSTDPTNRHKNKLIFLLESIKAEGGISETTYKKSYPTGATTPKSYGLPKVHKKDNPLRPIVSSIGSVAYETAKEFFYALYEVLVVSNMMCRYSNQCLEYSGQFLGSPVVWQSYINAILSCLLSRKYCEAIMDDLLLFTPNKQSHFEMLEDLLKALCKHGLKISPKKCQLFKTELQYMGNIIFTENKHVCVKPLRSRLETIQKLKPPVTPKGCKSFAGMVNFVNMLCPEL